MIIAQISDLHVRPPGQFYEGLVPSNDMAVAAVVQINALDPRPDLVVVTGDLTDGGTSAECAVVREILDQLLVPFIVLPGNHDNRDTLREAFPDHVYLPRGGALHYCAEGWPIRLIALDSTVPGFHHGEIDTAGLAWLDSTLARDITRPAMIFLHHHPFASGIPFLDPYALGNPEGLANVVRRYDQVERVVCGHVHRFMTARFAGTVAMSCPSTASQIALRLMPDAKPASFLEPPGILLHMHAPAKPLITHLLPIGDFGPAMNFF